MDLCLQETTACTAAAAAEVGMAEAEEAIEVDLAVGARHIVPVSRCKIFKPREAEMAQQ